MQFIKKIENILVHMYEAFLFILLPLWIPNGYNNLANDKYDAFMAFSLFIMAFYLLLQPIKVVLILVKKITVNNQSSQQLDVNIHHNYFWLLLFLFFTSIFISTFLSDYREQAFIGANGWNMGLFTYAILIFEILMFSGRKNLDMKITFAFQIIGSFIVNVIAILNRFYIYPVKGIEDVRFFISTIGNSNWYAGYLCIFLFLNTGIMLVTTTNRCIDCMLSVYVTTAAFCMLSCGSQSVFLFASAFFLLAILYVLKNPQYIKNLMKVFIFYGIASEAFAFSYSTIFLWDDSLDNSVIVMMLRHHLGIAIIVFSVFTMLLTRKKKFSKPIVPSCLLSVTLAILLLLPLAALAIQLLPLEIFSDTFGNSRGFIWNISKNAFYALTPSQKILGIGPDSMCYFLYNNQYFSEILTLKYGDSILTNSHSILLNNLLNWGIVALIIYELCFLYIILYLYRSDNKYCFIIAIILVTSNIWGIISFDNILFTPYVFCICGYGITIAQHPHSIF
ncbi:hypothetical protein [Butyrivibrio sp. YAB3001]|uniref:hypothetical protein n=1 Tax=Butyrivibrio sp. YAB3001 TaxID=1520812 RepID=UPI0008F6413D|nr:hypothetical protein [Butyrivibrio sp. YAB3001]SFC98532.1 hypothetical protein SAMN02910398_03710 [Butyrivibrio sp. YAB3001]